MTSHEVEFIITMYYLLIQRLVRVSQLISQFDDDISVFVYDKKIPDAQVSLTTKEHYVPSYADRLCYSLGVKKTLAVNEPLSCDSAAT